MLGVEGEGCKGRRVGALGRRREAKEPGCVVLRNSNVLVFMICCIVYLVTLQCS